MAYVSTFTNNVPTVATADLESDLLYLEEFQIRNKADFKVFLKEWREIHAEIVETIQFFKRHKNNLCLISYSDDGVTSWNRAVKVGKFANRLYKLRDALKESHARDTSNAILTAVNLEVRA